MKITLLFLLPGLLTAQVAAPHPGPIRLGNSILNVLGVPGNLLSTKSTLPAAEAVAFSSHFGLIATAGEVRLLTTGGSILGAAAYRGSAPILNIDRTPESAVAWLPSEQTILYWHNGRLESTHVNEPFAAVTSISLVDPQTARLLCSNPDGTVSAADISLPGGLTRNISLVPGAQAPAYSFAGHLLYSSEQGLVVETSNNAETLSALSAPFTAERMSENWVHLYFPSAHAHYALHLAAEPTLSQIPTQVAK